MPNKQESGNTKSHQRATNFKDGVQKTAAVITKVSKAVETGAKVANFIADLMSNHPEWYTHYATSSLVQLNLSEKQAVAYPGLEGKYLDTNGTARRLYFGMPAVAGYVVQLTVPEGDQEGWRTGIRLLWQQLRTANNGRINFAVQDLEKYVLNVRTLHALNAFIARAYETTYTFRSTNARLPQQWLEAMGLDSDDMMSNAADLLMYSQRFAQRCKVTFPLKIDLNKRSKWLFSGIFADSDSQKPSFLVTTFIRQRNTNLASGGYTGSAPANGLFYFTTNEASEGLTPSTWRIMRTFARGSANMPNSTLLTYEQFIANCDQILNDLIEDPLMSTIAADIVKAFQANAFDAWHYPEIESQVPIVYDEYALAQFQNANVLHVGIADPWNFTGSDYHEEQLDYRLHSDLDDGTYDNSTTWLTSRCVVSVGALYNGEAQESGTVAWAEDLMDRFNDYTVNWHNDTINPGEVLSITRLIPTKATVWSTSNTAVPGVAYFETYGTEVISDVFIIMPYSNTAYGALNGSQGSGDNISIAGTAVFAEQSTGRGYVGLAFGQIFMAWANLDWAPRIRYAERLDATAASPIAIGPDALDYDVYTTVTSNVIALYLSYSNQSLLYAGPSISQSSTRVYERGRRNYSSSKNHSGKEVLTDDKK